MRRGAHPSEVARAFGQGAQVLYIGSDLRLRELRGDVWMSHRVPCQLRWRLRPLSQIAGAARRGLADLLDDPRHSLAILGVLCLPWEVASRMLPPTKRSTTLVLDGTGATEDPDLELALEGVRAFCDRVRADLFIFP